MHESMHITVVSFAIFIKTNMSEGAERDIGKVILARTCSKL